MTTVKTTAKNWKNVLISEDSVIQTGVELFDNWFSRKKGMVKKSIILVTGTSGAGKTTLMTNLTQWIKDVRSYMYLREMESSEVKDQTLNLVTHDNAFVSDDNDCPHFNDFLKQLDIVKPEVLIVDSLQAIAQQDFPEMGEDEGCAHIRRILVKWTKANNAVCFIINHNTKGGEFAGKNTNMQMVDAHMVLEAEDNKGGAEIRTIYWGKKNRKGPRSRMYYEIQDGKIVFFSEEQYADKLTPVENVTKISFVAAIEKTMKSYEALGKNNSQFISELNETKKLVKKKSQGNNIQYLSDMMVFYNNLVQKYAII